MVAGEAKRLQRIDPRKVRVVDRKGRARWHPLWDYNPRFANPEESGDFQILANGPGLRPYILRKAPGRWIWATEWTPEPGEIYLTRAEMAFGEAHAGHVIVEPHIKPGASPNKRWARWQELVDAIGLPWAQMGPPGMRALAGVRHIVTETFREACAVLAHSQAYVGPEGGLHHASAAVGLPAVVLFGGFISPQQTGYAAHRNLFTGGEPCGMRYPCEHCRQAMDRITVAMVAEEIECVLSTATA